MRNKIYAMICILLSLSLVVCLCALKRSKDAFLPVAFSIESSETPDDFSELLKDTYGESEHTISIENIKLSLVKINAEKHYIKYSWVNYDLSNYTFTFFAEDIKKNELQNDIRLNAMLKEDSGKVNTAFYCELSPYPADEPLGYKQIVTLRFTPLSKGCEKIDMTIYYGDKVFLLEEINVML